MIKSKRQGKKRPLPSIELGTRRFFFEHMRQRRKNSAISLLNAELICLKTPHCVSDEGAREILRRHQRWILNRAKCLQEGLKDDEVLYRGKRYPLCRQRGALERVFWHGARLFLIAPDEKRAKELLLFWYKEQALALLRARVPLWAGKLGAKWQKIAVRDQKSRWGSCSSRGNLSFNWRLVMLPPDVFDYVVIHECAHLCELNHAPAFWQIVQKLDPHFKEHRRYLREAGLIAFRALRRP